MKSGFAMSSPVILWLEKRDERWADYRKLLHRIDGELQFHGHKAVQAAEQDLTATLGSDTGDPFMIITDSFGFGFAEFARERAPGIAILGYSRRAKMEREKLDRLLEIGVLDRFIPKPDSAQLEAAIAEYYHARWDQHEVVRFRQHQRASSDEVCSALDLLYRESVRNPNGVTGAVQSLGRLVTQRCQLGSPDDIEILYRELAILRSEHAANPGNLELATKIECRFADLRRLQEQEADALEDRLHSFLKLPLGEAAKTQQRAERLIQKYENRTTQNGATQDADDPTSQSG
ncbi:MAG: hypothetical protein O3A00_13870 [Planctomycetota bacterium]|nr:hypothetical protein [Planctomycetota bacterium]